MNEAQSAVLGSILIHPRCIETVEDIVSATDFDKPFDKIFGLLQDAYHAGLPISDMKWLIAELRGRQLLESIGGTVGIAQLSQAVGSAGHVVFYAKQVREAADRRRLKRLGTSLTDAAADAGQAPGAIAAEYESRLASMQKPGSMKLTSWGEAASKALERLKEAAEGHEASKAKWGIYSMDHATGGLFAGELIILAARPSIGKSSLAAQIALFNAHRGRGGLFCSLEMEPAEIVLRQVAAEVGCEMRVVRNGRLYPAQIESAKAFVDQSKDLKLSFHFERKMTVQSIRAAARLQASRPEGLALVVVDYLGLVAAAAEDAQRQRWEQIAIISRQLKSLALELSVPIVACCQLTRSAEKETPNLSHLRDSGSIEQDADVVMFLHRDRKDSTEATLTIAKNRNGCCGTIELQFDPERTLFSDKVTHYDFG